jgi:hypothetical protein
MQKALFNLVPSFHLIPIYLIKQSFANIDVSNGLPVVAIEDESEKRKDFHSELLLAKFSFLSQTFNISLTEMG